MAQATLRPSFFELYAAQHLTRSLRPALKFALEVLAVRHPLLAPFARRSDALFLAVTSVLEASQLRRTSATLAESFYGLRRASSFTPPPNSSTGARLSKRQILLFVLLDCVLPYVNLKAGDAHEQLTGGAAAALLGGLRNEMRQDASQLEPRRELHGRLYLPRRIQRLVQAVVRRMDAENTFIRFYPWVYAGSEIASVGFNLMYLVGVSRFFDASLALQNCVVRRMTPREAMEESRGSFDQPKYTSRARQSGASIEHVMDRALAVAKYAFVAGVFAFRFLEYYYAAEGRAPREGVYVPPPPEPMEPAPGVDHKLAKSRVKCPVCASARRNPALFTKSGYVFCYSCLLTHVQRHGECPVTRVPGDQDDIWRVYHDEGA